jgi:tetratricopeptide (TPR) repeat protein
LSLKEAEDLITQERHPEAASVLTKYLNTDMDNPKAIFLLGYCFMKANETGMAYQLYQRAGDLFPGEPAVWHNIGTMFHERQESEKAEEYFRKALKCRPSFTDSLAGLSMSAVNKGQWKEAIQYANRALAENPDCLEARVNRGMAYLALGRWSEGWRDNNAHVGFDKNRKEIIYGDEKRWDGSKGQDVVVYGEQGIGDEISFASCLPDVIRDSKSVTVECDGRIEKLLKRSFPTVDVHGTRYKPTPPEWRKQKKFDARVSLGQLPEFYRNKDSDFHGKAYLKPNPQMAMQWRVLLDSLGSKPKIGITWSGGLPHTGQKRRSVSLDTYGLLFKSFDADWVSLQYKEPEVADAESKYGVKIHDWEWGNRVFDYDQTVALISELDLVISVCTTVVHAAGGLGKECWCLVPSVPMWRYMQEGDVLPWGKSVQLYRQKGKEWPIGILLGKLRDKYGDTYMRKAA